MKANRSPWKLLAWLSWAAAGLSLHSEVSSNAVPGAVINAAATNAPADKAPAPETGPTPILDARAMARRVADRNIFDPDRQPRARGEPRPQPRPRPVVTADAPELGLVGVLRFERGTFAFFDGNAPEYRRTLQVDAVIAGHTVRAITPQSVTLSESNRPPVQLRVGQRLRKDSEGAWQLVAAGGADGFSRTGGSSGGPSGGPNAGGGATAAVSATVTATPGDPPGSDEILKRLLKKREQEMK